MAHRTLRFTVLLLSPWLLTSTAALAIECKTPRAWQPRLQQTPMDVNGDFIDDALDKFDPLAFVDVIVDLNRCPQSEDLARLGQFGTVSYASPWLSYIVMKQVKRGVVDQLVDDGIVAFVEHDREIFSMLTVSNPAVKVRPSPDYSPNTVRDKYPGLDGTGVNVAFIDTGVDDHIHQSLLGKFVGGADCTVDPCIELNPVDTMGPPGGAGHGTGVANDAIGRELDIQGIAPAAGLIDIAVGLPNVTDSVTRAIDKVLERKDDWNIDVVNLSLGGCVASNGTDAWSQGVNRMVDEGLIVVAAAGNCNRCAALPRPCSFVVAPGAADAAISVGAADDRDTVARGDDSMSTNSMAGPRTSDGDGDSEDEQKPDIAAPGTGIRTAAAGTSNGTATIADGSTSQAAPHVAGCAALLRQLAPDITPLSTKELLIQTAEDKGPNGWDADWGHGLLDCFAAVDELQEQLKTDLGYESSCGGAGPPCWLHPSLFPSDPAIREGIENTINAEITNHGPNDAPSFDVRLFVFNFSNDEDLRYDICSRTIAGLGSGKSTTVSCAWTPSVSGAPPGVVHACLKAEIVFPFDSNFDNNRAQHNINIEQTSSPAVLRMEVENLTDQPLNMRIEESWDCDGAACFGWQFSSSDNLFDMEADDCPRNVELVLDAVDENSVREARVNVFVRGYPDPGPPVDQGGVAMQARIGCVVTDLRFKDRDSFAWTPDGFFVECPSVFDVARGLLPIPPYPSLTPRGDFSAATCIGDDVAAPNATDEDVPPLGNGFYYLVRAGGPLPGTWDNGGAAQVGSRNDTLETCP